MFWQIALAAAVALGLIQYGAMSVWVTVLSLILKIMVVAVIAIGLYFILPAALRRYKKDD